LLGAAAVLVPFLAVNLRLYDHPLPPYYRPSFVGGHNRYALEALLGNLISPSRGLLVYSPVFAFSLAGFIIAFLSQRSTSLDTFLAACIGAHWLLISTVNTMWWGGASYGPRFFTDVTPYLIYLLVPFLAWMGSTRGPQKSVWSAAFVAAACASVVIHAQGALNENTAKWNAFPVSVDTEPIRVWDWRQPQFLAGLTFVPSPVPPVRLDAIDCREPPSTPQGLTTAVNDGGTVTLQWSPSAGHPTVYLLEIGSAAGSTDLAIREVRELTHPTFTARRAQPGTYYVRVRAKNRCGDSPPSTELVVIVQ